MSVFVPVDRAGVIEKIEFYSLSLSMLDFLLAGRQFIPAAPVSDINMLCSEPLCYSCSVHCDIARTDDRHTAEFLNGCVVVFSVGLHEVRTGQDLVCAVYAEKILSGYVQELRESCSGADEYCFISFGLKKLIDSD